ncbi:MAG: VWA domain-containing protein [bacterium]|nr:VWA domain-containing protein [bacterium]
MLRSVVRWSLLLLALCCTSVNAQYIIVGPPDDQTIIDTSFHPTASLPGSGTVRPVITAATGTDVVASIDLSQMDCSQFPYICGYVDVLNGSGIPVPGMTADSFCLYQDGVPVPNFSVTQLTSGNCITSVCLVVDVSGSMTDDHRLDSAKAAMHRFVNAMDPYDQVAIVTFANCWTVHQAFTSNQATLHTKINSLSAGGNTAVFDGIYKGVDITRFQLGSKAVIAFTDGLENRSNNCSPNPPDGVNDNTFADDSTAICNLANTASIPIYTFNLGPITNTWYNPEALQAFSSGTGGFWQHAQTGADMDSVYTLVKERLCSRYYVCYTSPDTIQNGDVHWMKVCKKTGPNCTPCDSLSCQETAPPVIVRTPATINLSTGCQPYTSPMSICAYVTDLDTPKGSLAVTLYYRTAAVSYTAVNMIATGAPSDSTFCATIPSSALPCASFFDYYITASDGSATVSSPSINPQANPYNITICGTNPPVANAGPDQTIFQCTPAQICLPASCSDVDNNLKTCEMISGVGTYNGSQICFTPSGTLDYEFVIKATDSCNFVDYDTVVIHYTLNSAPVADAGRDSTLFLCAAQPITWAASCIDPNSNLSTCQLIAGPGTYNSGSISFTPAASGVYTFILKATDACGLIDQDTAVITVTLNAAPICSGPSNQTIFQCTPTQVCLPYSATDANGNFKSCQIISGPGSLVGGNWCYTPSSSQTVNVTIQCEDSCNATCQSSFAITFNINQKPTVALGNDTTIFQCALAEVCLPYTVTDPNNNVTNEQIISGPGTIDTVANTVCFTPGAAGTYQFVVKASDACTDHGSDTIQVTINLNQAPVANSGPNQTLFQCLPTQICWPASCTDPNGNLSTCNLTGPGTYNGSTICFTPSTSGVYTFVLTATDACGLQHADTTQITVTVNGAPTLAFGADTSLFLCTPQQVCMSYSVSDPNGMSKLTEVMISGFGSLDSALNKVCFTPTTAGTYDFIVSVTDSCGATDRDTIRAIITFGTFADITCPSGPISKFLCAPGQVCQPLTIAPAGATVTSTLGTYSGGQLCFNAPTSGTYNARVIATTSCSVDTCDITFNVTINTAPVASAGLDQTIFQCTPAQICWPASCSDINGNLDSCKLISGPGTYNGSSICFTPAASGTYTFILRAVDQCGAASQDTVNVNVTLNGAPTLAFGADTSLFLCTPQAVCMNYTVSDPNGMSNLTEVLVAGFGTLDAANNKVCFTPTTAGTYDFIVSVTDSCGATDRDTIRAIITFGTFADITCPSGPISKFLCAPGQVCQPLTIAPAGATVTSTLGTYSGGQLCFNAPTSGTYNARVIATTSCSVDTCDITFNVTINTAPVASAGLDQTIFQCTPAQICWPASCSDINGNLDSCKLISGPGTYNGSSICFTPAASGTYTFILRAVDQCGAASQDTVNVNVTLNGAPTLAFGADTSLFLCTPQAVCMNYTVSDPNGMSNLTEVLIAGFGTLDAANNKVCFTPTTAGTYDFIVSVTDSCGATDRDTIRAIITFGEFASITCPPGPISASLCGAGQVCQTLTITPPSATVTTTLGTYSGGQLCFTANTTGTYNARVIATTSCSVDTCDITFNVTVGQAAQLTCPGTQTIFLCAAGNVSIPIGVMGAGALVSVTPIGSYSAGNIIFPADTTGHYVLNVIAGTSCGADTCQVVADVTINTRPLAVDPVTPKDTFLCASASICYQFSASDVNGGTLAWSKVSGNGTVSSTGLWCFTANTTGTYTVLAAVADSCGAADTVTMTYNTTMNLPPMVGFGNDTTLAFCPGGTACLPFMVADANNNVTLEQLVAGSGTIDTLLNQVCFSPASAGLYTFVVKATDACGAMDYDTINVTATMGEIPVVTCPGTQNFFLCSSQQICVPVTVTPGSASVTVTPTGSYSGGNVCFTPATSGTYNLTVIASTSCGADTCQLTVNVTINSRPVAVDPVTPKDTFICASTSICYQFSGSDVNGGTLNWSKLSGNGTVTSGGLWCFTAGSTGSYTVLAAITDSCGAADTVTMTYNVTSNVAPVIAFGSDTTLALCPGGSACLPYSISDANNNITLEQLLSGSGTINTAANTVCFSPASAGLYTFVVKATDACGAIDQDTINVTVTLGDIPVVTCPGTQNFFLCASSQICVPVTVSPSGATVTVSPTGSYSGGNVCFTPATSGTYNLTVVATTGCGADTCQVTVNVTINSRPVAVDPVTPKDTFICASASICYQFSASDVNGGTLNWSRLTGNGTVTSGGLWCFTAAGSGNYSVTAVVADSCGAADTVSMTYNVSQNVPPVASILQNDTTLFQCGSAPVCLPYSVTDANTNAVLEQLLTGGTIDTITNTVCFTPPSAGVYPVIIRVTDACGAVDVDTAVITIQQNNPPVANAGADQTLFRCTTAPICWPASASDPDGNLDSIKVLSGPGSYSAGQICFTPAASGSHVIVLRAVDKCGVADLDTVVITVTLNAAPVCQMPPNSTFRQCVPTQVSLPVSATDANGNFSHCQIVSGPGSLSGGQWTYTPSVDEIRTIVIDCFDSCGVSCRDSFRVVFQLNAAPIVNAGHDSTIFVCGNQNVCWTVAASDEDNNLKSVELTSPLGTYNSGTGQVCFPITYADLPTGQYAFIFKATDSCDLVDYDTTIITVNYNNKPVVAGPPDFTAYMEQVGPLCFDLTVSDPDNNLSSVTVTPSGTYNSGTGQVCLAINDPGMYCVVITATDLCGLVSKDTVCVDVTVDECMHVEIEKTHNALQGQHETVNVFLNGTGKPLGGFSFLIAYDASSLTAMGVTPGPLFEQCGWEYFTYRFGADGNCNGACPSGLIRIVGMAETNNGAYHPGCYFDGLVGSMAEIDFLVSNDRTLECMYAPVQFFWLGCTDNALSSLAGDTLWISRRVYNFEHQEITDNSFGLPGYVGAPDYCLQGPGGDKIGPQRCIDFTNGGIDIVCADSIDARADINLNGISYEIADAVLFSNYFVRGLVVFTVNQAGQVAASDVNADGIPLTVADLVYLIRAVVGDVPMTPKLSPNAAYHAEVGVSDGVLSIGNTDTPIGAISLVLEGQAEPTLHESASQMEIKTAYDGKVTRVLIYSSTGKGFLESGPVIYMNHARQVKSIELGSYDGYMVEAKISLLPSEYSLSQNYPNPFNPVTSIEFALPKAGEWTLTIYNVLGQEVTNWNKRTEAGYHKVEWDATQHASGVYFYRLVAGNFTSTKKMVLLK